MTNGFLATNGMSGISLDKIVKKYYQQSLSAKRTARFYLSCQISTSVNKCCQAKNAKETKIMKAANDNLAADMLRGADAIAGYLGLPRRTVYHAVAKGHLPHFRIGETVCARKSSLLTWIAEQEGAAA